MKEEKDVIDSIDEITNTETNDIQQLNEVSETTELIEEIADDNKNRVNEDSNMKIDSIGKEPEEKPKTGIQEKIFLIFMSVLLVGVLGLLLYNFISGFSEDSDSSTPNNSDNTIPDVNDNVNDNVPDINDNDNSTTNNDIDDANDPYGSATRSYVYGIINEAETYVASYMLENMGDWYGNVEFICDGISCSSYINGEYVSLNLNGNSIPSSGSIYIDGEGTASIGQPLTLKGFTCITDQNREIKCSR